MRHRVHDMDSASEDDDDTDSTSEDDVSSRASWDQIGSSASSSLNHIEDDAKSLCSNSSSMQSWVKVVEDYARSEVSFTMVGDTSRSTATASTDDPLNGSESWSQQQEQQQQHNADAEENHTVKFPWSGPSLHE